MGRCMLFKMSLIGPCDFEKGSLIQQNIFKILFSQGGKKVHKNEYYVYALDNVDNSGRPLKNNYILKLPVPPAASCL